LESLDTKHSSFNFNTPPNRTVKVASNIDSLLEADGDDSDSDGVIHCSQENRNKGKTSREDFRLQIKSERNPSIG